MPVERNRFDLIDQEQLAAQLVAVMDAHFQRPTIEEKQRILKFAADQLIAQELVERQEELAAGLTPESVV